MGFANLRNPLSFVVDRAFQSRAKKYAKSKSGIPFVDMNQPINIVFEIGTRMVRA